MKFSIVDILIIAVFVFIVLRGALYFEGELRTFLETISIPEMIR